MRDEIPAKPKAYYKIDRWVKQVTALRDMAEKLMNGEYKYEDIEAKMLSDKYRLQRILDRAELYINAGHLQNLKDYKIDSGIYTTYNSVKLEKPTEIWEVTKAQGKWGLHKRISK